ncbi:hypothetical protein RBB50_012893 [Rhinocladiella similis]
MAQVKNSICGFGFVESTAPYGSISAEQREQIFEKLWNKGKGFPFMFGGFCDIPTNKETNEAACQFIRKKIHQVFKDPEKARKLTPHDYYARRPLCDGRYYEQFNRENVSIVDLKETPITAITREGIKTSGGTVHELDVMIFATGIDAVDVNYNRIRIRIRIRGHERKTLKELWDPAGPTSYMGVFVPEFPNLFMITGPQGTFSNIPTAIEAHVDLIASTIERAGKDSQRAQPSCGRSFTRSRERRGPGVRAAR